MGLKINNNATTVLAASITNSATSISIQAGDGAKFPSLGAGDWFPLVLVNASGGFEIVKVTARVTDVLTVVRAQEGTAGTAFAAGDRADLRLTAAAIATFIQAADALLASNNLSDVANAATARTNLGLGTAATYAASAFATAAQGTKADNAATSAQGAKADTAVQPGSIGTAAAKDVGVAAGNVPMMATGGKYPAADGSLITNLNVTAPPIPTSSTGYPVGFSCLLCTYTNYGGGSLPDGTSVAGSTLNLSPPSASPRNVAGPAGTWKNISGYDGGSNYVILFVRTS